MDSTGHVSPRSLSLPRIDRAWKFALVGGLLSIPLSVGNYWLSGMGSSFSGHMVLFGGVLAGYLAQRAGKSAKNVGFVAGVVGGLPGYVFIFPALVRTGSDFAAAWSSVAAATAVMVFSGVFVVSASGFVGLLGGALGGWLFERFDGRRQRSAAT